VPFQSVTSRVGDRPDGWPLTAITVAVLLANLPYLLGFFDPNPLGPRSGLASSVVPGWLDGRPTIDPNVGYSSLRRLTSFTCVFRGGTHTRPRACRCSARLRRERCSRRRC
jgi:hypothetical protein